LPGRSAALDSGKLRNAARGVGEGVEVFDLRLEVGDEPFDVEKILVEWRVRRLEAVVRRNGDSALGRAT
jgi:hypothetical protein